MGMTISLIFIFIFFLLHLVNCWIYMFLWFLSTNFEVLEGLRSNWKTFINRSKHFRLTIAFFIPLIFYTILKKSFCNFHQCQCKMWLFQLSNTFMLLLLRLNKQNKQKTLIYLISVAKVSEEHQFSWFHPFFKRLNEKKKS